MGKVESRKEDASRRSEKSGATSQALPRCRACTPMIRPDRGLYKPYPSSASMKSFCHTLLSSDEALRYSVSHAGTAQIFTTNRPLGYYS